MRLDHILLLEDSIQMQAEVQAVLEGVCALTCVTTIADAEKALLANSFTLAILDLGLPDGDGLLFCRELRGRPKYRDLPIILLTAESDVKKKVLGFTVGADDYIVKPFDPPEFLARIESKLKRKPTGEAVLAFQKHDLRFDLTSQRAFLVENGADVDLGLTPNEFRIFLHLLRHEGMTFSKDSLLEALWGPSVHISEHTIATHVSTLRKKVGKYGECLVAIPKKGYLFSLVPSLAKPA